MHTLADTQRPLQSGQAVQPAFDETLPLVPGTLPGAVQRNARDLASRIAYREKEFGIWQSWTWAEAHDDYELAGCSRAGMTVVHRQG